jgi:hypothetical protein
MPWGQRRPRRLIWSPGPGTAAGEHPYPAIARIEAHVAFRLGCTTIEITALDSGMCEECC